jgi:hypothetical protein
MIYQPIIRLISDEIITVVQTKISNGENIDEINSYVDGIDMEGIYLNCVKIISDKAVKFFEGIMNEVVTEERKETDEFLAHLDMMYSNLFVALEAMYSMVIEAAVKYCTEVNDYEDKSHRDSKRFRFNALRALHGRACQIFLEILCLIKNGLADGAFARWRSLFEVSVIAQYISENDELMAKTFYESVNNENEKYKWAGISGDLVNNKRISFKNIFDNCKFANKDEWYRQYELSCMIVHASPKGVFLRLDNPYSFDLINVGRSFHGINTVAEHAAISLNQVSCLFLSIIDTEASMCAAICINKWVNIVRKYTVQNDMDNVDTTN